MAAPRQRRKNRSSLPKIRQRPKSKAALRNPRGNAIIAGNWDNNATVSQNYKRFGIAAKLNSKMSMKDLRMRSEEDLEQPLSIGSRSLKIRVPSEVKVERHPKTGAIIRVLHSPEKTDNPLNDPFRDLESENETRDSPALKSTQVVEQLEDQAAFKAPKRPRQQSQRERRWIERLVEEHGDDYTRMAMDHRLNPLQQTESDLRRRVAIWRSSEGKKPEPAA